MIKWLKLIIKNILFRVLIFLFEIKKTPKISYQIGICSLIRHQDVNMFIYNLMSLFYQLKKNLPVYVVDDGTLTLKDIKKLKKYFSVIVEPYKSSEDKMSKILKKYKNIYKFRFDEEVYPLRKKFDPLFLNPFAKFIYLDADLLFHKYPREIIDWLESKNKMVLYAIHLPYPHPKDFYNNSEVRLIHCFRLLLNEYFSCPIDPGFNSGLLCIPNKKAIKYQRLDKILNFFYKNYFAYVLVAEETALYFSFNYKYSKKLPATKYINVWSYQEYLKVFWGKMIVLHYSGSAKYAKFKTDAIKLAIKNRLFKSPN